MLTEDWKTTEAEKAEDRQAEREFAEAAKEVRERASAMYSRIKALQSRAKRTQLALEAGALSAEESNAQLEAIYDERDEIRQDQCALIAAALHWRCTPADIQAWCDRALDMGAGYPAFAAGQVEDLLHIRQVPNAPLRARMEQLSDRREDWLQKCADALGWDRRKLSKNLGMMLRTTGSGKQSLTLFVGYDTASTLARTMGMKPIDAGV